MSENTITTICWTVAVLFISQAVSCYCVVRLLVTGRGVFERRTERPESADSSRILGMR